MASISTWCNILHPSSSFEKKRSQNICTGFNNNNKSQIHESMHKQKSLRSTSRNRKNSNTKLFFFFFFFFFLSQWKQDPSLNPTSFFVQHKTHKTHNQNCLITKSKSKQKPTEQKSSQVAVFNRSLQNPKTAPPPPPPPPNTLKKGEIFWN